MSTAMLKRMIARFILVSILATSTLFTTAYAQNPSAVHNYFEQFSTYPNEMTVTIDVPEMQVINSNNSSTITNTVYYQNVNHGSGSTTYTPPCKPCVE